MGLSGLNTEIESKKVNIQELFSNYWFSIPEYQRPYSWKTEQVSELLDDLKYANENSQDKEYFLGSIVLQKGIEKTSKFNYEFYNVLDGQQRLTTLLLLMAVLRDLSKDEKLRNGAKEAVFQNENKFKGQPERMRIEFKNRDKVELFIEEFIKKDNSTNNQTTLFEVAKQKNISIKNMINTIIYIREQLGEMADNELENFAIFLFNKVVIIYVASDNNEDAFRMFTILNDRGIPLTNSDIIKSMNIGEIKDESKRKIYAKSWEEIENHFEVKTFERFLGYVRTILTKEKARENLLKEFEKIYHTKLLKKGEETLKVITNYKNHYDKLIHLNTADDEKGFQVKNLITVMCYELSSDWIPPYLYYYDKFKDYRQLDFLKKLESKILADVVLQLTPSTRLNNTYRILNLINKSKTSEQVIDDKSCFSYDKKAIKKILSGNVYSKKFTKYILLKLEYILTDHTQSFPKFTKASIEHVLPQNPAKESFWIKAFSEEQKNQWVHKLANLALISRHKNSKLSNLDFDKKKEKYFRSSINVFSNINQIMHHDEWTPKLLEKRQEQVVNKIMNEFL